jgi:SAM-dependent methyltransferase
MGRWVSQVLYNFEQLRACAFAFDRAPASAWRVRYRQLRFALRRLLAKPLEEILRGPYNSALRREAEVGTAIARLERLALLPHQDGPKNWDAFRAFSFILEHAAAGAAVLDMGSSAYGRILGWLHLYGFRDLHGCDLVFQEPFVRGAIEYTGQDIEATSFPSKRFDFVTCLSVIEHGVRLERFFNEAARLLKTGGFLVLSTDYWASKLPQDGLYDDLYDCSVHIFSREEVRELLRCAASCGFEPVDTVDDRCEEKVVFWERLGLRFTFLFLVFRLQARP